MKLVSSKKKPPIMIYMGLTIMVTLNPVYNEQLEDSYESVHVKDVQMLEKVGPTHLEKL